MLIRFVITCAAVAAALSSTVPVAARQDARAAGILSGARKAIGGSTLDTLKTFAVEATLQRNLTAMQLSSDVEILLALPDKYVRADTSADMGGHTMTMGFNGEKPIRPANATALPGGGMMIRIGPGGPPPGGAPKLSPEEQAEADRQALRAARADISRLMLGWFATTHPSLGGVFKYVGDAESPDGKAHVVEATADGFTARLFVDAQTWLPLMVTYKGPLPRVVTSGGPRRGERAPGAAPDGRRDMSEEERGKLRDDAERRIKEMQSQPPQLADFTIYFEDWRNEGGLRFPHVIRRATGGATVEEWTVNRVKVNPKIDARRFEG